MIRIKRANCPSVLENPRHAGDSYRVKSVVKRLWTMQCEKCCYCETKIPQAGHGKAVEHFRPKSVYRGHRNDWKNLLLACPQCNGAKSDKFPIMLTDNREEVKAIYLKRPADGNPAIIDPSHPDENPEAHLTYCIDREKDSLYGQILPRNNSTRGELTIEVTDIRGTFLQRRRRDYLLKVIEQAYLNLLNAHDSSTVGQLDQAKGRYELLMDGGSEYAGLARDFARRAKLDERFNLDIPGRPTLSG